MLAAVPSRHDAISVGRATPPGRARCTCPIHPHGAGPACLTPRRRASSLSVPAPVGRRHLWPPPPQCRAPDVPPEGLVFIPTCFAAWQRLPWCLARNGTPVGCGCVGRVCARLTQGAHRRCAVFLTLRCDWSGFCARLHPSFDCGAPLPLIVCVLLPWHFAECDRGKALRAPTRCACCASIFLVRTDVWYPVHEREPPLVPACSCGVVCLSRRLSFSASRRVVYFLWPRVAVQAVRVPPRREQRSSLLCDIVL